MKKKETKHKTDWFLVIYGILAFICMFANVNFKFSLAEGNIEYTNVLTDLQKDAKFSIEDYPFIDNDYSLQVIQIAESADDELFVYVYQPCREKVLTASYLNMSTTAVLEANIYELELLNYQDTLFKYKVKNFMVLDGETRQYDIISIYRPFEEGVDIPAEGDNTITNVVYSVSKTWYATTSNNQIIYQVFETETIEITDKFCGYVRYPDGYLLFHQSCDSHFVVFSTDRPIEKLISARVYYTTQSYECVEVPPIAMTAVSTYKDVYGEKISSSSDLNNTEKVEYVSKGWISHEYSWDRISSVAEFISNVSSFKVFSIGVFNATTEMKINPNEETNLFGKQWVLRFAETPFLQNGNRVMQRTIVGDVSILQLKFETFGKVYDLGVVDNMQTGSDEPINNNNVSIDVNWWLLLLFAIIIGLIIAFPSILITLFNVLFTVFKFIFKILWWLITAPFALLKGDDK